MHHLEKPFLVAHNNALRAHIAEAGLLAQFEQQLRESEDFHVYAACACKSLAQGHVLMFWADEDGYVRLLSGPDVPSVLADWDFLR